MAGRSSHRLVREYELPASAADDSGRAGIGAAPWPLRGEDSPPHQHQHQHQHQRRRHSSWLPGLQRGISWLFDQSDEEEEVSPPIPPSSPTATEHSSHHATPSPYSTASSRGTQPTPASARGGNGGMQQSVDRTHMRFKFQGDQVHDGRICIALSGGGPRAAAHASGVFCALSNPDGPIGLRMSNIKKISSSSGGGYFGSALILEHFAALQQARESGAHTAQLEEEATERLMQRIHRRGAPCMAVPCGNTSPNEDFWALNCRNFCCCAWHHEPRARGGLEAWLALVRDAASIFLFFSVVLVLFLVMTVMPGFVAADLVAGLFNLTTKLDASNASALMYGALTAAALGLTLRILRGCTIGRHPIGWPRQAVSFGVSIFLYYLSIFGVMCAVAWASFLLGRADRSADSVVTLLVVVVLGAVGFLFTSLLLRTTLALIIVGLIWGLLLAWGLNQDTDIFFGFNPPKCVPGTPSEDGDCRFQRVAVSIGWMVMALAYPLDRWRALLVGGFYRFRLERTYYSKMRPCALLRPGSTNQTNIADKELFQHIAASRLPLWQSVIVANRWDIGHNKNGELRRGYIDPERQYQTITIQPGPEGQVHSLPLFGREHNACPLHAFSSPRGSVRLQAPLVNQIPGQQTFTFGKTMALSGAALGGLNGAQTADQSVLFGAASLGGCNMAYWQTPKFNVQFVTGLLPFVVPMLLLAAAAIIHLVVAQRHRFRVSRICVAIYFVATFTVFPLLYAKSVRWKRWCLSWPPFQLMAEIIGMNVQGPELHEVPVYLADGGHVDNLALLPLLREQEQHIISVASAVNPLGNVETAFGLARTQYGYEFSAVEDGVECDAEKYLAKQYDAAHKDNIDALRRAKSRDAAVTARAPKRALHFRVKYRQADPAAGLAARTGDIYVILPRIDDLEHDRAQWEDREAFPDGFCRKDHRAWHDAKEGHDNFACSKPWSSACGCYDEGPTHASSGVGSRCACCCGDSSFPNSDALRTLFWFPSREVADYHREGARGVWELPNVGAAAPATTTTTTTTMTTTVSDSASGPRTTFTRMATSTEGLLSAARTQVVVV